MTAAAFLRSLVGKNRRAASVKVYRAGLFQLLT